MRRKLIALDAVPEGISLLDTLGDGDGNFYSVINITPNEIIAKNRETKNIVRINKEEYLSEGAAFHKLPTAPVTVYNLNDERKEEMPKEEIKTPEPAKEVAKIPEPAKEPETPGEIRLYLRKINEILNVAEGIGASAEQYLYDLVSEIFRNGFDEEFGGERDD